MVDWIAFYVIHYMGFVLQTDLENTPKLFRDIVFSDFFNYIYVRFLI